MFHSVKFGEYQSAKNVIDWMKVGFPKKTKYVGANAEVKPPTADLCRTFIYLVKDSEVILLMF